MAGFKLKTRKAAAKRFWKATAKGQIRRSKGSHGHFLAKRGQKARLQTGTTLIHETNYNQANKLVPSLGAKRKRSQAIQKMLRRLSAAAKAAKAAVTKTAKKEG
jgi:large subunit ribosomal protein L35